MQVDDYLKDAVREQNEKREEDCKEEVRSLVASIIHAQSVVSKYTKEIVKFKLELKELQKPDPVEINL